MVQVFSKGKVSAEEISGQLGERLPGAVTKFAKANNMSLPEFQKQLEQGRVGLREMMNFIIYLGNENAEVADKMAKSSQDAGARLTVAYNDMRISIGAALQPVGAQLQETFSRFVTDIAPAVAASAKAIADAFSFFLNNEILSGIAAFALKLGLVTAATVALRAAITSLIKINILGWFTGVSSAARITGDVMATSAVKATGFATAMRGLFGILKSIAALGAITVAIDVVVRGFAQLMAARQALKELNARRDPVGATGPQPAMTAERRYTGAAREKVAEDINKQREYAARLRKEIQDIESQLLVAESVGAGRASLFTAGLKAQADLKKAQLRDAQEVIKLDLETFKTREQIQSEYMRGMNERFKATEGSGSSKTKKERESQLPQLQAQLAVQQQIAQINAKIRDAQLAENQFLQIRLEGERELAQIAGEIKALAFEKIRADEVEGKRKLLMLRSDEARKDIELRLRQAEKQNLVEITKQSDELAESYTAQIENRQRLQELVATGMKEALALEYIQIENMLKIEKERLETRKALQELAGNAGGAQETQDLIDRLGGKETGLKDLAAGAQETEKGKLQEFIEQAEAELRDLEALAVRISQNIGNAIGNSLANGLTGLIEGTTTAKQIFADFLKDVGQILIQEGAKMIATYIAIGIAKIFAGLASGGSGGGGEVPGALGQATNTGLDTGAGNISDMLSGLAAKGAYFSGGQANFAQNSIKPFATGGIVTKPTFFKYADGGTFNNGVMGEAGPEAIMPLKRGADGKLGVAARLDGAMKRYRSTPGSAAAAAEGDAASLAAAGAATMEPIDVRYSVERINSVDYVTADQFQRGMQQAAAQGAKQGEQRALSTLKQNTNTSQGWHLMSRRTCLWSIFDACARRMEQHIITSKTTGSMKMHLRNVVWQHHLFGFMPFAFSGTTVTKTGDNQPATIAFPNNELSRGWAETAVQNIWIASVQTVLVDPDQQAKLHRAIRVYVGQIVSGKWDDTSLQLEMASVLDAVGADVPRKRLTSAVGRQPAVDQQVRLG
jgi:tape measure domain-containing protein